MAHDGTTTTTPLRRNRRFRLPWTGTLFGIGIPAGTAIGGLLLQHFGTLTAMLTLAATLALSAGYALSRPEIRRACRP